MAASAIVSLGASSVPAGALPYAGYADLPAAELVERIRAAKAALGAELLILGHHYQRDDVVQFADLMGDSLGLSRQAADSSAPYIVFCGVHFMAESADVLTGGERTVILPDMGAGCSMADMAQIDEVEAAWAAIAESTDAVVVPITYMNSEAALKAFCGRHGGAVCTSTNAEGILRWAFERGQQVMFFPDQHLGRNIAHLKLGIPLEAMALWDPFARRGGLGEGAVAAAKVLLWKGHCSVHQNFMPAHVDLMRERFPGVHILVHPECMHEVVAKADLVGSTDFIIRTVRASEPGTRWAIGTEQHMVSRLAAELPDREIHSLSPWACTCATMYRIDLGHLAWALENLVAGHVVNRIQVPAETARWARVALERMLAVR